MSGQGRAVSDDLRLSVVVPTLGRASVRRTVDGVVASARAAEVGVQILVVWQAEAPPPTWDPPVEVVDVFPVGTAHARNRGWRAARAPLIGYVDDDEVVDEGWVAAVLATFDAHADAAGVFGAVRPLGDDGIPYCEVSGEEVRVFRRPSTPPWVVGTGGNMAFRRSDLDAIGGFDVAMGPAAPGRSGEETDVMQRLLRSGRPLVWTPHAVVYHPTKTAAEHLASRRPYGHGTGAVARRRRDAGLAARYAVAIAQSYSTGVVTRDRQRRREALRTAAGFAAGVARGDRARSPMSLLSRMPTEISAAIGREQLRALPARFTDAPEFRYRAGKLLLRVIPGARQTPEDAVEAVVERDAAWVVERR